VYTLAFSNSKRNAKSTGLASVRPSVCLSRGAYTQSDPTGGSIHTYIQIYIAPKSWERIWGAGTGWLDGKGRLEIWSMWLALRTGILVRVPVQTSHKMIVAVLYVWLGFEHACVKLLFFTFMTIMIESHTIRFSHLDRQPLQWWKSQFRCALVLLQIHRHNTRLKATTF